MQTLNRDTKTGSNHTEKIKVVLFSGGRGSEVLSIKLFNNPLIDATLIVNGYDDGKSTGEVRRFLGNCLGPSDFRKNAARLAAHLESAPSALIELIELRLPENISADYGRHCVAILQSRPVSSEDEAQNQLLKLVQQLEPATQERLAGWLEAFVGGGDETGREFDYSDCAIGNMVLGGCFVAAGRDFNFGLVDFCEFLGLPPHLIENVTAGQDAYLVALSDHGELLASEADIVDATHANCIEDIYLVDHFVTEEERARLAGAGREKALSFVEKFSQSVTPNPLALDRIRKADLIVYSPGTQHSSLFPSYMTPGVGRAIAGNLRAIKLLITNLEEDADIVGSSAVGIIDRAVYYLREKNQRVTPQPALVTHYLLNDSRQQSAEGSYIPLGSLDRLQDPRLVRIDDFEGAKAGHHDASKVLQPFIDLLLRPQTRQRVAVLLLETDSPNKLSQTMTELVRSNIEALPLTIEVYYNSAESFDADFQAALPFAIHNLSGNQDGQTSKRPFREVLKEARFDYVVLFESSGMYKGDDIVNLLEPLSKYRFDAIWGSRRLSINDIHMAYGLVHRNTPIKGAISYLGSHALSLTFLLAYGRYLSDTLSGIKVINAEYLRQNELDPEERGVNFKILSVLLRDRAEIFETPVHYFPISPEKVHRTSLSAGLHALITAIVYRFKPLAYRSRGRSTMRRPLFDSFSSRSLQRFAAPDADRKNEPR
jgi:2-phospho-L-lactate transferase/gluconeogenesis factor (CofD/UPF0052 family)